MNPTNEVKYCVVQAKIERSEFPSCLNMHVLHAGEELEMFEEYEDAEEAHIMDVDILFGEEAISQHLARAECLAGGFDMDNSLDAFH